MDKDEQLIVELKRRAKEDIRYGSFTVDFKVQDGKIVAGEIVKENKKLG